MRGGWNAPGRWLEKVALRGNGDDRERISKSLGSGARALHKYECDAMPKWKSCMRARGSKCELYGLVGETLNNRPRSRYR
eukprot:6206305-Pleurochrysis_carterae.AAC.2